MKLQFIDNRPSIVQKVKELDISSIYGDYFVESERIPNHVICSASNPVFTFGGGLDAQLYQKFPSLCDEKRRKGGYNERIENICFLITVDNRIQSNDELVRKALQFAFENTKENETLCLMGLGCMIGGLDETLFTSILKEVCQEFGLLDK